MRTENDDGDVYRTKDTEFIRFFEETILALKMLKLDAKPFHLFLSRGKNSERVRYLPLKRSLSDCVRARERVGYLSG
jgi:hypothetical protein